MAIILKDGTEYKTMSDVARAYNIDRKTLKNRFDATGDIDIALSIVLAKKEEEAELLRIFGVKTITEVCHKYGISHKSVYRNLEKCGNIIEALHTTINNKLNRESKSKLVFRDMEFKTFADCCRYFKVSDSNFTYLARKQGRNKVDVLEELLERKETKELARKEREKKGKTARYKVTINGIQFNSITNACEYYGISATTIKQRVDRGMSLDEAFSCVGRVNPIEYNGVVYESKKDLAEAFGLSKDTLYLRLKTMSLDEALHYRPGIIEVADGDGKITEYESVIDACNKLGLKEASVHKLGKRLGITAAEVIKTGAYKKIKHNPKTIKIECMLGEFDAIKHLSNHVGIAEMTLRGRLYKSNFDIDVAIISPTDECVGLKFIGLDGKARYKVNWSSRTVTARQIIEHYRPDLLDAYDKSNPTGKYNPYVK